MEHKNLDQIRQRLDAVHQWPSVYMFKFIVPSENEKIAQVQALFDARTAEIRLKVSSKGAYTSITAKEVMTSADNVLEIYDRAGKIEGLIAL